jgi:hypothetical protein
VFITTDAATAALDARGRVKRYRGGTPEQARGKDGLSCNKNNEDRRQSDACGAPGA